MDEDLPATGCNIVEPPTELADSHPPREVPLKRIQRGVVGQANAFKFVRPALQAMSSSQAYNSSAASPQVFILNDSFHNMLNYKAKHNKFPSTYDDMVSFLSEVLI